MIALKDRRRNLAALMQANRGIENHDDGNLRIVNRREAGERGDSISSSNTCRVAGSTFCAVPVLPAEL